MHQARERSSLAHDSSHEFTMGLRAEGQAGKDLEGGQDLFLWPTPPSSTVQGLPWSLPVYSFKARGISPSLDGLVPYLSLPEGIQNKQGAGHDVWASISIRS